MELFEVYHAYMVFENGNAGKERPVLVMDLENNFAVVYNVTSQYENKSNAIRRLYYPIRDWKYAGLDKPSYVDTVKARYVPQSILIL
ncbi:MAG: hypothetical protein LBQ97_08380 [Fusobacteriaceae bacterium]|jgi:hypothetical protein|nr:hypothetical protein [Fusobacteriaceae bacterium]